MTPPDQMSDQQYDLSIAGLDMNGHGPPTPTGAIPGRCFDIDGNTWHKAGETCRACGFGHASPTIPPPASPLPWRKLVSDRSVYVKIVDANGYVVAESVRPQDADFIVAIAAARTDTGESR